jgi:protein-tyrosine phosphatase
MAGSESDHRVTVHSAGTRATLGPVPAEVVSAATDYDVDLSGHVSRQLTAEMLDSADIVVGLAREHVREATLTLPEAFGRTFTLREVVRRAQSTGSPGAGRPLADWLAELADGRTARELLGSSPDDDVSDPYGGPARGYTVAAAEIDTLTALLAGYLAPTLGNGR